MPSAVNNQPNVGRPGIVPIGKANRGSQIITTIIPANSSIPVLVAGDTFYLTLATAQVSIKPNRGVEANYSAGTGLKTEDNPFDQLQITNPNANNVIISLFVGFGDYIDNRVILYDPLVKNIVYPTFPIANAGTNVLIPDRSGSAITDINGTVYLALSRVGIYVSNLELASVYYIRDFAASIGIALGIQPSTSIVYPASGNYSLNNGGSPVNAIVSEIYQAVTPTLT